MNREQIFTDIYTNKKWGSGETISGEGSTLENTMGLRDRLPDFLNALNIKSVVDAPCGDFHWFNSLKQDIDIDSYIGIDIVRSMILDNQIKYSNDIYQFMFMDLCTDVVPRADVIICRDCLMHLSNEDSLQVLRNFKQSGSKYLLITTNPNNPANMSIESGKFRHLNMMKAPFNLPVPVMLLNEEFKAYGGMFNDKSLGLWKLDTLPV